MEEAGAAGKVTADELADLRKLVVDDEALVDRLLRASAGGPATFLDEVQRIADESGLAVTRATLTNGLDAARADRRARWV